MKTLKVPFVGGLADMSACERHEILAVRGACLSVDCAPWPGFPFRPETTAWVAADENHLFVRFDVVGPGLKAEFDRLNEPVWQDSCVEVFLATADGQGYRNFELNCTGTLLSAFQTARGVDTEPISETDAGTVLRHASVAPGRFTEIPGEHSWSVTAGIPFALLGYDSRPRMLRGNFYKCADGSRWPHYLCWSPIDTPAPDFHRPEFFGTLELEQAK